MLIDLLFVILGIVVLVKSADFLVESSSDLATKLGVSAVVVGAIIVGFGTSMPEMAVSTTAAVRGDIDLGIGNVVGSIIANLTLVLGATTFAANIPLPRYFIKFHIPLSMNAVFWFFVFAQNGFMRYEWFYPSGNAHYFFMVDVKRWKEGEKQFRCLKPRTSNPKSENRKRHRF